MARLRANDLGRCLRRRLLSTQSAQELATILLIALNELEHHLPDIPSSLANRFLDLL